MIGTGGFVSRESHLKIRLPPAPRASSDSVKSSMQGNRSERTRPENLLESKLHQHSITGFFQNDKSLPGSPDFSFPQAKLAVFVNGCYWHRCPYCKFSIPNSNPEYWTAKFARNVSRDRHARWSLRQIGWQSLIIWECKLLKHPNRAVSRIIRTLEVVSE